MTALTNQSTFADLIQIFFDLIQLVIPVIASMALLAFFWGLAKFILALGGDEKVLADGKNLMKWGLVALFIMVSVWGILRFAYTDIGFTRTFGIPFLPQ